jgi:hypothetical protein
VGSRLHPFIILLLILVVSLSHHVRKQLLFSFLHGDMLSNLVFQLLQLHSLQAVRFFVS